MLQLQNSPVLLVTVSLKKKQAILCRSDRLQVDTESQELSLQQPAVAVASIISISAPPHFGVTSSAMTVDYEKHKREKSVKWLPELTQVLIHAMQNQIQTRKPGDTGFKAAI